MNEKWECTAGVRCEKSANSCLTCDLLHLVEASGRKEDKEKIRTDLIPPEALEELAKVLTFGAKKYDDRNWEQGIKWGRVLGAALRHIIAWEKGELNDQETGLSHLSHALCNLAFLVTYEQRLMKNFDDIHPYP